MSVLRDGATRFVQCDSCGDMEELDLDKHDKQLGVAIRAEGYSVTKDRGRDEWKHYCRSCNRVG